MVGKISGMKKGQAAAEFYAFLGIFLFVFAFISYNFLLQSSILAGNIKQEVGDETSGAYADMINFAAVSGNGFYGYFRPPSTQILDSYYNVSFKNRTVIIYGTGREGDFIYIHPLSTANLTGDLNLNSNGLNCVLINNTNGTIDITRNPIPCPG